MAEAIYLFLAENEKPKNNDLELAFTNKKNLLVQNCQIGINEFADLIKDPPRLLVMEYNKTPNILHNEPVNKALKIWFDYETQLKSAVKKTLRN